MSSPLATIDPAISNLLEATSSLVSTLELSEVLSKILKLAELFLAADAYAVWGCKPGDTTWRVIYSAGLSDAYSNQIIETGSSVWTNLQLVVAEDVNRISLVRDRRELYRNEGVKSFVAYPIRTSESGVGTVTFYFHERRRMIPDLIQTGQLLANISNAAINAAEIHETQKNLRRSAQRAADRAEFLAHASNLLASSLDYNATLNRFVQLAVPQIADWCSVSVVEGSRLQRIAAAHSDPGKMQLADEYSKKFPPDLNDSSGISRVIRQGKPQLVAQVTDQMLRQAIPNEEQYQILRQLGMKSVLIVPLISRGAVLGALTLVTAESGRVLGKEDLEVAKSLATRAAVAIDNSRLYEAMSASRNEALSREEELRILDRVGSTISVELDLKKVVQSVTDAGRELSGAEFGAFFYNVLDNTGEKYMLYTLSGAPEEAFNKFPMPRNTAIFAPTFSGEKTVRIDDVRKDERYGKSAPYYGMPPGHLPVRSYLAVSVKSRSGEVLGGLFYGHSTPGVFTERSERLLEGIAKQASIAIENANLFEVARRQKTQLQESEAQLRAIIETTPECVKIVRRDGTLLHMNSPGLRMVEAENAEMVVGKSVYDLVSPEDRSRFQKFNEKICAGETGILEFDLIGFRGSRRSMETHAAPLQTPEGTVQLAVTRDVTDRKRSETVTGRLAAIVESSDDAIVSKNLDGIITSWNKAAERIFGYRAEEAIGQPITLIIPPERHSEEATIIDRIRNGHKIDHFETFRRRKDGTQIELSLTISPVKDSAGRIVGASKVARDITERRRSEVALREGEERLRKTEKLAAAGQLAASLAHEINNPLSSVTNALYLLNSNSTLDEAARDVLGVARAELSRMSRIVKQSLSYYRADSIPKDVNVAAMVNESLQVFSAKFDGAGIQLTKKITDSGTVPGFADEIRQVIDNLLLNAVESMPNGGRLILSVHPSREWKDGFHLGVRMTIADSGVGMPKELLSKIFEPFFTTKPEKGTGLGMWVVRGIVAKHEGSIRVRSSVVRRRTGTIISVLWPRSRGLTGSVSLV